MTFTSSVWTPGAPFRYLGPNGRRPARRMTRPLCGSISHRVQYVYVRKQAYGTGQDDDAWRLESVIGCSTRTRPCPRPGRGFLAVCAARDVVPQ